MYNYKTDPQYLNSPQGLKDRYEIYHTNASDLGWRLKTFSEWLST